MCHCTSHALIYHLCCLYGVKVARRRPFADYIADILRTGQRTHPARHANLHQDADWSHGVFDRRRERDDKDCKGKAQRERWRARPGAKAGLQQPRARGQ